MERDVSLLANCLFCDSYFVYTVTRVTLADYRGNKGKQQLDLMYLLPDSFIIIHLNKKNQIKKENIGINFRNTRTKTKTWLKLKQISSLSCSGTKNCKKSIEIALSTSDVHFVLKSLLE
jgi:hypothetical protein